MKKIGRNDSCPCGSNLKYKNCCMNRIAIENTIMEVMQYLRNGRLDDAESICRRLLAREPTNPDALHLSGMIAHRTGEYDRAIDFMNMSLAVSPEQPVYYCNIGNLFKELKRYDEAVSSYRKALELDPENLESLNNLGVTLKDLGRLDEAAASYRKAININPGYAMAHFNLGDALKRQDRVDEAVVSYKRSFAIDPNLAAIMNSVGLDYLNKGMLTDALTCFQDLVTIKPDHVEANLNLGIVYHEQGRLDEAIAAYRQALAIDPDHLGALNNLGTVFYDQGKFDEAIACYRKALTRNPDSVEPHMNIGNALRNKCRFKEAIAAYENALSLNPDYFEAFSNLLFTSQYLYSASNKKFFTRSVEFGRRFEAAATRKQRQPCNIAMEGRRIRIGLVSGDLKTHPVGFFLESALRHLDKESISLVAYANQFLFDELSERIKPFFSDWIWVRGMSDAELASRIRADGIDILIDLSGHTAGNRLQTFALKPAPVQVTWIGYANTTGLTFIDYILADPVTVPVEEERFYTEKVWRLPETYLCYTPPDVDLEVNALPALEKGDVTFGCFNNPVKLNQAVIECWAKILQIVPESRLFSKYKSFAQQSVRDEFTSRFESLGINPARLLFEGQSPRADYLASYRQIDFALDPFPFPGANTTCEAAWMGVPTLTLRMARGIAGHNGELIMKSVGLADWVAQSIDEYVEKAQTFARDAATLADIRSGLRQRLLGSPLCDGDRFARHLENAFNGMLSESGQLDD